MFCRQCGSQIPLAAPYCDVCGHQAAEPRPVTPPKQQTHPLHGDDDFKTLIATAPKPKSNKWGWAVVAVLAIVAVSLVTTSIVLFVLWSPWGESSADKAEKRPEQSKPTPRPTRSAPVYVPTVEPTYEASPQQIYEQQPAALPKPPPRDIVVHQMFIDPLQFRYIPFTVEGTGY